MTLYAVSLLFSLEVEAPDAPKPVREIALHVLSAADEAEARAKGEAIGVARQITFKNGDGETVRDIFMRVVEVQWLAEDHLFDGMEVASWMFERGECLVFNDDGTIGWLMKDGSWLAKDE